MALDPGVRTFADARAAHARPAPGASWVRFFEAGEDGPLEDDDSICEVTIVRRTGAPPPRRRHV
jgi:hypothetical protein